MERGCFRSSGLIFGGGEHSSGTFSWTQRNYICSFCKRQFSSAQALGGHMNVHRRDRARLRELPSSWFLQCSNTTSHPIPKHNFSSATSFPSYPSKFFPYSNNQHSLISQSHHEKKSSLVGCHQCETFCSQSEDIMKKKSRRGVTEVKEMLKWKLEALKEGEVISLDLEIGCKDPQEVLDLELRLG